MCARLYTRQKDLYISIQPWQGMPRIMPRRGNEGNRVCYCERMTHFLHVRTSCCIRTEYLCGVGLRPQSLYIRLVGNRHGHEIGTNTGRAGCRGLSIYFLLLITHAPCTRSLPRDSLSPPKIRNKIEKVVPRTRKPTGR